MHEKLSTHTSRGLSEELSSFAAQGDPVTKKDTKITALTLLQYQTSRVDWRTVRSSLRFELVPLRAHL